MDEPLNPLSPEFQADPYPAYHALRAFDPVHYLELPFPDFPGVWVLSRYADVVAVLRDERFSARKTEMLHPEPGGPLEQIIRRGLLVIDPPDHARIRTLVTKAFTPRVIEQLRPRIQAIVDQRLDGAVAAGALELIGDLAAPLPIIVIAELLGIPDADLKAFKRWSDDLAVIADGTIAFAGLAEAERSAKELQAYLEGIFAERRADPREDLITGLVGASEAGDTLSREELLGICTLILVAGHETTTNLIGNGMLALLRHPAELARLRDNPSLLRGGIEELLRYDSPVQLTSRIPTVDVEIDGRQIRAGQEVDALLGAANRDPAQFPDPDRLDVTRADVRNLSFGCGIHFCLGASLARLEGQIAIGTILRRLPGLRLVDEKPEWRPGFVLHGLRALPLEFDRDAARRARAA